MALERLFLITRRDLSPGQQASQLVHAMADFSDQQREIFDVWHSTSNTVVLLTVGNEAGLFRLTHQCIDRNIPFVLVREPDLNNAVTAMVLPPAGRALVRDLPLAFT